MEWALMPLKRYADFTGRSRRKEYWYFTAFLLIMMIVVGYVFSFLFGAALFGAPAAFRSAFGGMFVLTGLIILIFLIPSIAVQVRRFHDQDKSGWFVLLGLIPYAGPFIVLVFMCLDGTPGPNGYGEDPKADERL